MRAIALWAVAVVVHQVAVYSRALLSVAFLIAAGTLASVTFYELYPGRMSPNGLVDDALERIRSNDEVPPTTAADTHGRNCTE